MGAHLAKRLFIAIILSILVLCIFGCTNIMPLDQEITKNNQDSLENQQDGQEVILVGFSQLGAESDWRSANTISMKEAFSEDARYRLLFEDGQQKQSNQITAIRRFIQQEVDYIVLAPVTEEGWDTVLQEAKDAGIPVILVDRMISVEDESLYCCYVGSDFALEGMKLTEWLNQFTINKNIAPEDINIVNIQGSLGSSAQIGRTESLREAVDKYGWNLLSEENGDFTETKAKEVMASLLQQYDNINVVYCENDNEAFGAITAIEAAGRTVGSNIKNGDIMVIAFDGVSKKAVEYVTEGKITCIAECNPLHGPRVHSLITTLNVGGTPQKISYVYEGIITADRTVENIYVNGITYEVTFLE